jgi:hypothetical protein
LQDGGDQRLSGALQPGHGLGFQLGEAADAIRETTVCFSADKIAPLAARIDAQNAFPRELWRPMAVHRAERRSAAKRQSRRNGPSATAVRDLPGRLPPTGHGD